MLRGPCTLRIHCGMKNVTSTITLEKMYAQGRTLVKVMERDSLPGLVERCAGTVIAVQMSGSVPYPNEGEMVGWINASSENHQSPRYRNVPY